ncbi:hypothetical protein [Salegentibacter salarius]|uniref:Calcium-binding protein n=1 Tax=Salegentibacter salarius TaxID=435906 RepID=A0A2N0U1E8_9FLAO|nr:hypothetical protein [Salegentibacter salarius]OEY73629.1 hypothetical protein BHS39_08395 [Salegentibacter salarius]PKD20799.1 hypothetical protein APR40_08390 [Salegentibacter salarius]SLJ95173.1 hypothetical protein SAMN05660445_01679 [Salegentibacter salarius]
MKKIFAALLFSFALYSCDDGDITVTSFDLEDSDLSLCEIDGKKVLWVVNNEDVYESMSLELDDNRLNDTLTQRILTLDVNDEPIEINLSGEGNRLVYRIYDGEINGRDYFCQGVPPGSPRVLEEYVSAGGTVTITTSFNDLALDADADGDGLLNAEEGYDPDGGNHLDTDGDGIPDYLDIDDDNDNVPTESEITANPGEPTTEEGFLNTDGEDNLPDYLDPDDDNDGVLTRHEVRQSEVEAGNIDPRSLIIADDGVANYRKKELSEISFEHELQLDHSINRDYRSNIVIEDFNLIRQDGSGEDIRFDSYNLGRLVVNNIPFELLTNRQQELLDAEEENEEENEETTTN